MVRCKVKRSNTNSSIFYEKNSYMEIFLIFYGVSALMFDANTIFFGCSQTFSKLWKKFSNTEQLSGLDASYWILTQYVLSKFILLHSVDYLLNLDIQTSFKRQVSTDKRMKPFKVCINFFNKFSLVSILSKLYSARKKNYFCRTDVEEEKTLKLMSVVGKV